MALAEMCKARVAVHKDVANELAAKLQTLGCCEFVEKNDAKSGGALSAVREQKQRVDELLSDAKFLVRLLEPYEAKKESSLSKMLGDIPTYGFEELAAKADEEKFRELAAELRETERKLTETRSEISRLKGLSAQAAVFEDVKFPLEFFTTGTETITGAIYAAAPPGASNFVGAVTAEFGDMAEIQIIEAKGKDAAETVAVLCRKSDFERLQELASEHNVSRVEVPKDFSAYAVEEKEKINSRVDVLSEEEAGLTRELSSRAREGLYTARVCGDYWSVLRDRADAMGSGVPTEETLIWEFWLPKSRLKKVSRAVEQCSAYTGFSVIEPDDGEEPPTLLKEPAWCSCVEPLTVMFGTPTYGAVDPTPLMSPFFFLFLGMCFGDAGYGLLVAGVLCFVMARHNLSPTLRSFFVLMTVGMAASVIFGTLTFSWFGDALTAFPFLNKLAPVMQRFQILDPMNDPMTLLVISIILGLIQVLFGLAIAFYENWRSGDRFAAIADQGGWILFIVGLVSVGCVAGGVLSLKWGVPSKAAAIGGALLLVATQGREKSGAFGKLFSGVMSLYNVTGYLGDILSYSRLLALGLGSAAVAMVINLLATLVSDIPYVGIVLAVLIFVLGHAFSIAVNLLGAFIHSLRLQYVEFFGKFYNASGRDFSPLRIKTQYSRIKEEAAAG